MPQDGDKVYILFTAILFSLSVTYVCAYYCFLHRFINSTTSYEFLIDLRHVSCFATFFFILLSLLLSLFSFLQVLEKNSTQLLNKIHNRSTHRAT